MLNLLYLPPVHDCGPVEDVEYEEEDGEEDKKGQIKSETKNKCYSHADPDIRQGFTVLYFKENFLLGRKTFKI